VDNFDFRGERALKSIQESREKLGVSQIDIIQVPSVNKAQPHFLFFMFTCSHVRSLMV
jgi:hypothetical protein